MLKGKVKKIEVEVAGEPKFIDKPTEQQLKIRKSWMEK